MNKQTTAAVIIILVTCLLGYGVTSIFDMTALERLEKIMNANVELTSYHMDVEGQMDMELQSENDIPDYLSAAFKMYDNMKITINADVVMKPDNVQMKILENVDMGGMAVDIEVYLDNDELIVKYPVIGNYVLITVDDIKEALDIELPETFTQDLMALMPQIQKDSSKILMSHLNEYNTKYGAPYVMTENGYEQTLNVVEIEMDSEMLIQVYADIVLSLLDNEKGLELVQSVVDANDELVSDDFTETFSTDLSSLKIAVADFKNPESETRKGLDDSFGMIFENMNYNYKVGLTNLNIPKMMWINVDMLMPMDGMNDINLHASYDIIYKMSQFNEFDSIEMPMIEEDDITRLSDLIEKFGGY